MVCINLPMPAKRGLSLGWMPPSTFRALPSILKDPNIVYVAAQGALYSHTSERGVYKSTDGGATWKKILFVDDKTGCVELSMDMNNPRVLYAAMNEYGRLPWKVISGGEGSGLYKSTDEGATWKKFIQACPKNWVRWPFR